LPPGAPGTILDATAAEPREPLEAAAGGRGAGDQLARSCPISPISPEMISLA
jgi:hypothetical protein